MIAQAAVTVLFAVLGVLAIAGALAVVCARRLLRAAVCLMGVLGASAGLYLLLDAQFLAGIQVLVYVGGIVVLIVFAVMLTSPADLLEDHPPPRRQVTGIVAALAFLAVTAGIFWSADFGPLAVGAGPVEDAPAIGRQLLDFGAGGYVLPFEVISLLLLAALIGGIVVARKVPPRDQPLTSGGDQAGEAVVRRPRRQRQVEEEVAP
ncbi:MAG: NADH-quinone oxidoreductase subunit J [Candidatus Latescibacterota bacterium]